MPRAKNVDEYLRAHPEWEAALVKLRKALLDCGLEECIKWGAPCYTVDGKNVVGIAAFKEHCGLWFFQGVHLADPDGVLVNAQEGKTKAMRQMRFGAAKEIRVGRIKAYAKEAMANERAGVRTGPARADGKAAEVPPELQQALGRRKKLQAAFAGLTPGRQREYCAYIAEAKRAATKESRVAKVLPLIEAGVGLHDKYRNC